VKIQSVVLIVLCFLGLFLVCYAPALFQNQQFGFRDAGYFYYPLHQRVQEEWNQGRLPLWEPEENGGVPLLGNPTAAVLYPGKLIFAVLPYAWGARLYIVMHTALAFVAMLVLLRSWGTSWSGSGLAALAYTFGTPVLFQYCNVIYLVGAAWLPLGMHAVDRWVRLGRRWGIWLLAIVLAMQVLGGDPQAAYLLGLSGAGYALGLAWARARRGAVAGQFVNEQGSRERRARPTRLAIGLIGAVLLWAIATIALGVALPRLRERHPGAPPPPLRWMPWAPLVVNVAWGVAASGFVYLCYRHWRVSPKPLNGRRQSREGEPPGEPNGAEARDGARTAGAERSRSEPRPPGLAPSALGAMWLGLVAAAMIAASMAAAQLLPVIEFIQQTSRSVGGMHGLYHFSVEPYRFAELVWPNIAAVNYGENSYWLEVVRLPGVYPKLWVPSLYLGGLTVVLAAVALGLRQGPPWRVWLSAIAIASALGALGQYTGPIWLARTAIALAHSPRTQPLGDALGPVDVLGDMPIRRDGFLRDGDGSVYWWLATLLPGFTQFRYPAKLFTYTALALAALAGIGWDRIGTGRRNRAILTIGILVFATACVLAGVTIERESILAAFRSTTLASDSGPLSASKAYEAIVRSLVHGLIVLSLSVALVKLAPIKARLAGAVALLIMTLDLAVANSRHVVTVEQSLFEGQPALASLIEKAEAESQERAPGPFRVHRMIDWKPLVWNETSSPDRARELVAWERATLRSKYGINFGIEYTHTQGVAELYDHDWYFGGFLRVLIGPVNARDLGTEAGTRVIYFPRRAFDLWNTRYFVVPAHPNGWTDPTRASAAFRFACEFVYPKPGADVGATRAELAKTWQGDDDVVLLRNEQAFPRAWVVHDARAIKPGAGPSGEPRAETKKEILHARDPLWAEPRLILFDPRQVAWLSRADLTRILPKLSRQPPKESESVKVSYPSPQRATLDVTLESPGLVVLCDVYYPGWQLTIDQEPAPIYRVNVLMRGAIVSAGKHRLEYSFAPRSFQAGLVGSVLGILAWLALGTFCALRPADPLLASRDFIPRHTE
jgi:hypothetical protein